MSENLFKNYFLNSDICKLYNNLQVGELRFKHPLPNTKWDGILNATVHQNLCNQIYTTGFIGTK